MTSIKWLVSDVPKGRYRSFDRRGWPTATVYDDRMAFRLSCEDEYIPAKIKTGDHAAINIWVAVYSSEEDRAEFGAFQWKRMRNTAATLKEAKEIAKSFVKKYPDHFKIAEPSPTRG